MKKTFFLLSFLFAVAGMADDASVSDVSCRQLWPWSGDVEITFTVSGKATPVSFVAQYDGVEPFTLSEYALSGDFFNAAPGRRRVRWSPARAGLDAKALNNFRIVSATPKTEDGDRTYLILNMVDGSYSFRDSEPEGGWINHELEENGSKYLYATTNMVFRRIPAGTAKLGLSDDLRTRVGLTDKDHPYSKSHTATISSDFYIGVYPVTTPQWRFATNYYVHGTMPGVGHVSKARHRVDYATIRGSSGDTDGINWPNTKFAVSKNSIINAFRNLVKNTFPKDWHIDLPTSAQWEYACRATTDDNYLWSVGGVQDDDDTALTNLLNQIASWAGNSGGSSVGTHKPNGWGLYDMIGLSSEWNVDWYSESYRENLGVDPVGPYSGSRRIRRTYESNNAFDGWHLYTSAYKGVDPEKGQPNAYRLCIHLASPFEK